MRKTFILPVGYLNNLFIDKRLFLPQPKIILVGGVVFGEPFENSPICVCAEKFL